MLLPGNLCPGAFWWRYVGLIHGCCGCGCSCGDGVAGFAAGDCDRDGLADVGGDGFVGVGDGGAVGVSLVVKGDRSWSPGAGVGRECLPDGGCSGDGRERGGERADQDGGRRRRSLGRSGVSSFRSSNRYRDRLAQITGCWLVRGHRCAGNGRAVGLPLLLPPLSRTVPLTFARTQSCANVRGRFRFVPVELGFFRADVLNW